ncbi:MAG TPA: o-succinylbenzoate--CoA ligase [Stenomitos sp.]
MVVTAPTALARRLRPHQPALIHRGRVTTYEELDDRVIQAARGLLSLGVAPGQVVGVWAANGPEWVAIAHAVGRIGAILLPLNIRLTDEEIAWQVERAEASLVLADAQRFDRPIRDRVRMVPLLEAFAGTSEAPIGDSLDPGRVHTIIFTSGTTGRPKGALLSWGNQLASATASTAALGLTERDRWLLTMALFHVGGLNILHRCALAQAAVVIHERFDPEAVLEALVTDGVSVVSVVPAMLRRMLDLWGDRPLPPSVRAILIGGAPIPPDLIERCPAALPTYGMTETCSHTTLLRPGADAVDRASAGTPLFGTDVRIVDEHRNQVPTGVPGMIEVRSPTVFQGYLKEPEATAATLVDGWLRTGDDGYMDDRGCLHMLSRRSDLIISGGENVYPSEIERVLEQHPGVYEAAVVGADDHRWGQVPVAFIVPKGDAPAEAEVRAYVGQHLARYKVPRKVMVIEALPRLGSGKLDRQALRRRALANAADATPKLN